ncbi:hypothetical protein [Streptomyces xanthochromogenes]|uniref:hypothetical protein n=1 Tax=Streptomyces xanthochromogenes TaxID=67384 RepID=UPI002F41ED7E
MSIVAEHLPTRPCKSSAGRRRRHVKQLGYRIHQIAPTAYTVLLNPIWTDAHGAPEVVFMATVRDGSGRALKLRSGDSRQLAALVQGAFPTADWSRPQTWRADINGLAVATNALGRWDW